jgi:OHCU decarboxylase
VTLDGLNALDDEAAARELRRCCGSSRWVVRMVAARPFASAEAMARVADDVWDALDQRDWLEAFAAHPKIGAGPAENEKPAKAGKAGKAQSVGQDEASEWSAQEQARVANAAADVRARLAERNREYEARFGYIFIVCATGRSADEMLGILESRLGNDPHSERHIAAAEQRKITRLRLHKLIEAPQDTAS